MTAKNRVLLSTMMFLEFFIWGAWFVTMGTFLIKNLNTSATQVGLAYLSQSIGAIVAPFFIGLIADRFFAAQRILGILHLLGAAVLYYASTIADFTIFFPAIIIYMALYMPTLALVNSVSFRQMSDPSKEFPPIRVLGTIGWIVAGVAIGGLAWEQSGTLAKTFEMAALASAVLGVLSFFLPDTPPKSKGQNVSLGEMLGLDAISMLKNSSYLIFFIASIAISIPLAFYYNFTNLFLNELGMEAAAGVQSLGQVSEIFFMLVMPLFFVRLGLKKMLALGMIAWVLRYLFFAFGDIDAGYWMLIVGILLHGVCYDFFFVTGQIYTDAQAGEKSKSAAQGLITLATYGLGMLIGSLVSGPIVDYFVTSSGHAWTSVWMIPAGVAAVVALAFIVFFREEKAQSIDMENI